MTPRRAAFLDRDGVVNAERNYVHRWEDFEFIPGSIEAMRRLHEAGHALVVVTNQAGLARGLYGEAEYSALTERLRATLAAAGAPLAGVYHCPHHPHGTVPALARECDCRKPRPGMLLQAARELGLSLPDSLLVGDKSSDAEAARAAGVGRVFLVRSGHALGAADAATADAVFDDLAGVVAHLLGSGAPAAPDPAGADAGADAGGARRTDTGADRGLGAARLPNT